MNNRQSPGSHPPAGLVDVLNPTDEQHRDSAYYSSGSGDASKHTSVVSNGGNTYASSPTGYQSDTKTTPPPISALNQPIMSPAAGPGMSVASIMSPKAPSTPSSANMDRSMLDRLNNRGPADASQRSSCVSSIGDGRRESVDSRSINNGLDQMKLNGSSPYTSNHPSSTSIQATLQNQRDPRNGPERLSASRFPSNYSASHSLDAAGRRGRMAPAITGPSAPQFAHGHIPVAGQAWAGPFGDEERGPQSTASIADSGRQPSYLDSRRNSVAESYTSTASQLTTESALPRGQRRLEEGYPDSYTPRPEHSSTDLATTHHHQLKHKQLGDVMDQEGASPGGTAQPYSRTPELRVSHKLAERKRRDEMKQLYDNLRDLMPQERGNKASKWEILSKAINEHKHQSSVIRNLSHDNQRLAAELEEARRDAAILRDENRSLRAGPYPSGPPAHHGHQPAPPSHSTYYPADYDRSRQEAPREPYRTLEPPHPQQESMNGVQYTYQPSAPPPPGSYRADPIYGRG